MTRPPFQFPPEEPEPTRGDYIAVLAAIAVLFAVWWLK